jgi:phage baseplate assembly protein W
MATNYGREMSCTDSLKTGRYVTGLRIVAEAAYRRLTTPRGMLQGGEDEADYGIDLTDLIGASNPKSVAASLPGRIQNELLKDERIETVEVDIVETVEGPATALTITIECASAEGVFTLQVAVDDVTVSLLGIDTEEV